MTTMFLLKKNNLMFNQKFQVLDYDGKFAVGNGAKFWIEDNKLHCDSPEMNTRLIMLELFVTQIMSVLGLL